MSYPFTGEVRLPNVGLFLHPRHDNLDPIPLDQAKLTGRNVVQQSPKRRLRRQHNSAAQWSSR
jgi:hypothetical protein